MIVPEASLHLRDAAGRGRDRRRKNRLHRVDHQKAGLDFLDVLENALQRGFAQDQQIRRGDAQTLGAHLDLARRFLAGNVETGDTFFAYGGKGLQQQRRFADTRVAADQDHRAGHQPAAEDAVKLADAGKQAAFFRRVDGVDRRRIFFGAETELAARR